MRHNVGQAPGRPSRQWHGPNSLFWFSARERSDQQMRALSESSGPDLGRLSWVIWVTFKTLGAGGDFVHHIAAATRINTATAIAIEGHRTRSPRVGEAVPTGTFPEVVSRFRRRRSARSSAALW